jgi:cytochrome c peroxidase
MNASPGVRGIALAGLALASAVHAEPLLDRAGVLPSGTDFGEPALEMPRQVLTVERLGSEQNFLIALGNLAFSSPSILGGLAGRAGISCSTCHVGGDTNPAFFLPGHSARPGTVDVTGPDFNPKTDDGLFNPVAIPSLRGIKQTAPYGRDGRTDSLREFTHNVIVHEFAGGEPDALLLDALVAYMQQFEFLPNPKLSVAGRLTGLASDAARRGERLFFRPSAAMGAQSCASCHLPSASFVDGRQHDVGTGAAYDTPTLRNLAFTAPYFHDGRAPGLAEVVAHFDQTFGLGLSRAESADLVAYLEAVGDAKTPFERKDFAFDMAELEVFAGLLDQTLAERRADLTRLIVDTVNAELREIAEHWYRPGDRDVRSVIAAWAVQLRRVDTLARKAAWAAAQTAFAAYRNSVGADLQKVAAAERRSTYEPAVLTGYLQELRRVAAAANK